MYSSIFSLMSFFTGKKSSSVKVFSTSSRLLSLFVRSIDGFSIALKLFEAFLNVNENL